MRTETGRHIGCLSRPRQPLGVRRSRQPVVVVVGPDDEDPRGSSTAPSTPWSRWGNLRWPAEPSPGVDCQWDAGGSEQAARLRLRRRASPGFDAGLDGDVAMPWPPDRPTERSMSAAGSPGRSSPAGSPCWTRRPVGRSPGSSPPASTGSSKGLQRVGNRLIVGSVRHRRRPRTPVSRRSTPLQGAGSYLNVQLTGHHSNSGSGAQAPVGTSALDVSPDGSRLVVVGNFRKGRWSGPGAGGGRQPRPQRGDTRRLVDRRLRPAVLVSQLRHLSARCRLRPPSGDYRGGDNGRRLCRNPVRHRRPVGERCDREGSPRLGRPAPAATPCSPSPSPERPSMSGPPALDEQPQRHRPGGHRSRATPGSGRAHPTAACCCGWNPWSQPPRHGRERVVVTDTNLWVGSDTEWISDYRVQTPRLAQFRVNGGAAPASDVLLSSPGRVYVGGAALDDGPGHEPVQRRQRHRRRRCRRDGLDWGPGARRLHAGGQLFYGWSTGTLYQRAFNAPPSAMPPNSTLSIPRG